MSGGDVAFEMAIAMAPFSVNSNSRPAQKRKAGFIASLRQAAAEHIGDRPMLNGRLYARIIWLHDRQTGDPDNIIKAILDALETVVYATDRLIVKCMVEKIDLSSDYTIASREPSPVFDELLTLISESHRHILYIEVGEVQSQQVAFGPIS
jgi:hypothetical protein